MLSTFDMPTRTFPGQLICPQFDVRKEDGKDVVYSFEAGPGTILEEYEYQGSKVPAIVATLIGKTKIQEIPKQTTGSEEGEQSSLHNDTTFAGDRIIKTIKVTVSHGENTLDKKSPVDNDFTNNLPKERDIVLTRVTRISLQRANLDIIAVENEPVPVDSGVGSNGSGIVAPGGSSGASTYSVAQTSSDFGDPFRGILRSQDVRSTERDRVKMLDCFKPGDIVRAQVLSLGDGNNYYLTTARKDLGVVFARASNGHGNLMYAIDWQHMISISTGATEKRKCAKPFTE